VETVLDDPPEPEILNPLVDQAVEEVVADA